MKRGALSFVERCNGDAAISPRYPPRRTSDRTPQTMNGPGHAVVRSGGRSMDVAHVVVERHCYEGNRRCHAFRNVSCSEVSIAPGRASRTIAIASSADAAVPD